MKFDFEREADKLLFILIMADLVFIIFHLLHAFCNSIGFFYNPNFSLTQDRGYAEVFQYLKEFWATVLLIVLAMRASNLLYFCWSLLFGYFLIDDSFGVHEALGGRLGHTFGSAQILGLNAQSFGELFVSGFFGFLFLLAIGVSYRVNDDEEAKEFSRSLFILLIVLMVFGVVIGLFRSTIADHAVWQFSLKMLEEGGEMLIMSVMFWFVFRFNPELAE